MVIIGRSQEGVLKYEDVIHGGVTHRTRSLRKPDTSRNVGGQKEGMEYVHASL